MGKTQNIEIKPACHWAGYIYDGRKHRVTQLDPVVLYLRRQHEVVDAETLSHIVNEPGVRMNTVERASLIIGCCGAVLVIAMMIYALISGDIRDAPYAKTSGLLYLISVPWFVWYGVKRKRFDHVRNTMLKYKRCPHCGYDLRMLPVEQADGLTICPECGCAWELDVVGG